MAKVSLLILGVVASAVPLATAADARAPGRDGIEYGCGDLVVVGRLAKQDYQHVEIEGDMLGHGWVTATANIGEVMFGHPHGRELAVRYFAHTYMREDRDFLFVLKPIENGRYYVRSATLVETHPELADRCGLRPRSSKSGYAPNAPWYRTGPAGRSGPKPRIWK